MQGLARLGGPDPGPWAARTPPAAPARWAGWDARNPFQARFFSSSGPSQDPLHSAASTLLIWPLKSLEATLIIDLSFLLTGLCTSQLHSEPEVETWGEYHTSCQEAGTWRLLWSLASF